MQRCRNYCPWDAIKYCQAYLKNKNVIPENYWANASGNAMVRRMELTYNELDYH